FRRMSSPLRASCMAWFSSGVPPWFIENSFNLVLMLFSSCLDLHVYFRPVSFEQCGRVEHWPTILGLDVHCDLPPPKRTLWQNYYETKLGSQLEKGVRWRTYTRKRLITSPKAKRPRN